MNDNNSLTNNSLPILKVSETFATPEIELNIEAGIFRISGSSYPEDPVSFYEPVYNWFQNYAVKPLKKTVLHIHFKYFNTSSTQIFFDIFNILENLKREGEEVVIKWYYDSDNEEIKENGENFSTLFSVPFEMIEVQEIVGE